ncbi:hypothetical protein OJ997_09790 [Solirubrobacter phytolaccae]|uniref:Uncharacterized protein n=1 Tax=Solirubrobacter phytolaccae TaxID=1404360 RepID=A0A9X3N6C5_9ACTN|nr:hypothetical protein [Solirubrobacter phytolaccae]MDA0180583.1 hypothetical protein [Solirubrobacter phytolaccae]
MSHSKCLRCRSRVWRDVPAAESAGFLCPGCGSELEPVTDLSELIGLRALRVRPRSPLRQSADHSERISQQIRQTIAAHDAERQRRIDALRP